MIDFTIGSITELFIKCAILFVCGSFLFDIVHYILHEFENSRFRILRWLGGLHGVHHLFLDKQMQIQKQFSTQNIILHILPEYITAIIGVSALGFFVFGWLPAAIVILIRTVMVIVYIVQQGRDFTHQPLTRISGQRSLFFVGPQYHALHHVYPLQYYSSFVNVFDLLFGTNCQIKDRKFFIDSPSTTFEEELLCRLEKSGGMIAREGNLSDVEVLIIKCGHKKDFSEVNNIIDNFKSLGRTRLLPPEIWLLNFSDELHDPSIRPLYLDKDLTLRYISASAQSKLSAKIGLFLIKRGFRYMSFSWKSLFIGNYLRFVFRLSN